MKGITEVEAGICGYSAHIEAEADSAFDSCRITLRTDCPNIKKIGDTFEIDIMETMKNGYCSKFRDAASIHFGCAVVEGIYQAMKVAGGIALPKDIVIRLSKE